MTSEKAYELFLLYKKNKAEYDEFVEWRKTIYLNDMAELTAIVEEKGLSLARERFAKRIAEELKN